MEYPKILPQIKMIDNLAYKHAEQDFKGTELTPVQGQVLMYLAMNPHKTINQKDIERELSLSNPTVSGLLNRLEKKGFIQKVIAPNDNRYKIITLTEKSMMYTEEIFHKMNRTENLLLKGFSSEEIQQLNHFLNRIAQNISENQ
ncbi:MAG: MarR family winged helix-turn-helix transcriptional regulator [Bacillus sp. (in: firmicutes)]